MIRLNKTTVLSLTFLFFTFNLSAQQKKSADSSIPTVHLNNGIEMPILGLGTMSLNDSIGIESVVNAISIGYRLFDTATIYGNEEAVGKGIKESGIDRQELFITTKLWVEDMGYEKTKEAFNRSLQKLGLEYIDLYLIHRPKGDIKGSWKAMEELYEEGKIKAIGVSNFEVDQLLELISYAKIKPAVNQIEYNPFFQQDQLHNISFVSGVQAEAWSPFAGGRNYIFDNFTLAAIGKKYNKTNAQVVLKWITQKRIVAIPRTDNPEYMKENMNIFDFILDDSDMEQIATLNLGVTQFPEWD